MIFLWFCVGVIVGVFLGVFVIVNNGSPEINDEISQIRKARLEMHKAKLKLQVSRFVRFCVHKKIEVSINGEKLV